MATDRFRYWAFISYSHADRRYADWLHARLEGVRLPALAPEVAARAPSSRRLVPIFLDRAELAASPDLERQIVEALAGSMALIVIATPAAAASRRVGSEVDAFAATHGAGRIFKVTDVDVDPGANGRTIEGPRPFSSLAGEHFVVRRGAADDGITALAAALTGTGINALHRDRRRRLALAVSCAIGFFGIAWLVARPLLHPAAPSPLVAPWIGRWDGWVESTCGYYSGAVTQVIRAAGPDRIHLDAYIQPGDHFAAAVELKVSGSEATSAAGQRLTVRGDTVSGTYPPACQRGTTRRRSP